ncbi:MAG: hypothetical protein M3Q64_03020, partial [bacterium]|nr:hypothetical protein [bacterium]
MTRCAQERKVFFWEEPLLLSNIPEPKLHIRTTNGITVITPHVPNSNNDDITEIQKKLLNDFFADKKPEQYIFWYYSPMSLNFSRNFLPASVVYDCMDELSMFRNAPEELKQCEQELLGLADTVFTGGYSLYEAKRNYHHNIHAFPSSIEHEHFALALKPGADPEDQIDIPHPRIGFAGVIDERFDIKLLRSLAKAQPSWHFVLIGPVRKINPKDLPQAPNI